MKKTMDADEEMKQYDFDISHSSDDQLYYINKEVNEYPKLSLRSSATVEGDGGCQFLTQKKLGASNSLRQSRCRLQKRKASCNNNLSEKIEQVGDTAPVKATFISSIDKQFDTMSQPAVKAKLENQIIPKIINMGADPI